MRLTLFLANKETNQPFSGLNPVIEQNEKVIEFKEAKPGIYEAEKLFDLVASQLTLYIGDEADLVDIVVKPVESHSHDHSGEAIVSYATGSALVVVTLLLGLLGGFFIGRRRRVAAEISLKNLSSEQSGSSSVASLILLCLITTGLTERALAHAGHSHGELPEKSAGENGEIVMTKRSQFLIGVTTQKIEKTMDPRFFRTSG